MKMLYVKMLKGDVEDQSVLADPIWYQMKKNAKVAVMLKRKKSKESG